jgi:hypothetical protein
VIANVVPTDALRLPDPFHRLSEWTGVRITHTQTGAPLNRPGLFLKRRSEWLAKWYSPCSS